MKKLLLLLFTTILSFSAWSQDSLGRIVFMDSSKNHMVVRKHSKMPMKFVSPINKKDTIYIGVMADSISNEEMNLSIYGYFPLNIRINGMIIILEYTDGSEDVFKMVELGENNYGSFSIINDLYYLYSKTPKKIKFRNFAVYDIPKKNKNFFIDFFKKYD